MVHTLGFVSTSVYVFVMSCVGSYVQNKKGVKTKICVNFPQGKSQHFLV